MITATLARQHGIKGPVVVVQVVNATLDTERHGAVAVSGGHVTFVQPLHYDNRAVLHGLYILTLKLLRAASRTLSGISQTSR